MVHLHKKYGSRGFEILAFPCNQFMDQEPGTEAEIKKFAQSFDAEFPMFAKIDVNGPDTHEVYRYLRCNSSLMDKDTNEPQVIPWSWSKFLVD